MLNFNEFKKLYEGGSAISDSRPMSQEETKLTYEWIVKKIYPIFGIIDKIDAKPIGSYGKKATGQTSGDIDIAVATDVIAGNNHISVNSVLDFVEDKLKSLGYDTSKAKGFNQVSFAVPINGNYANGIGQVDFMFTDSLNWSEFIYHSPDFSKFESKYKGLYRNILLMKIISNAKRKTTKITDSGETEEYESYVVRLNQGVVQVTKSFKGKTGLVKNANLLKDQDKFITNTPEEVSNILFGPSVQPSDIMTFEDLWRQFTNPKFIHKDKFNQILKEFIQQIKITKVPIPTEIEFEYPNFINENLAIKSFNDYLNIR